jgi:hypothetical protein
MQSKTITFELCRRRDRRDAVCRRLLRCTQCGRVMQAWERLGRCNSCRVERDDDRPDAVAQIGGVQ